MEQAVTWLEGLLLLWVPGSLLYSLLRPAPRYDAFVRSASTLALGLAFWPLLFLWTTICGVHWGALSARIFVAVLAAVFIGVQIRRPRRVRLDLYGVALIIVIAATAISRIVQVRNVVLPVWVDSVHHTMIARLLLERGTIPDSYAPFIANSSFYYHWGFHAVFAFVAWIRGWSPQTLPVLLLSYGQFLNALTPLMVYAGARVLLGTRRGALIAAVLASLVSFFPAYYVSWGRYTHLMGVLLLPPFIVALVRSARRPSKGNLAELVLLAAGLALIHVRVALFALTFAVAAGVAFFFTSRRGAIVRWAIAGSASALLVLPWYVHLLRTPTIHAILAPNASESARWERINDIPADVLWAPNNIPLIALGTGGLAGFLPVPMSKAWRAASIALWLALIVLLERKKRRRFDRGHLFFVLSILAGWTVVTLLIINSDRIGLPPFRPVTNSAAIITMFLPLSLAGAGIAAMLCRKRAVAIAAALIIGTAGMSTMTSIINPQTLLARPADVAALRWIAKQTPRDSVFAVGVQPWIGGSFVGVDGGYWISLMTDRRSILPPGLYSWVAPARDVAATNAMLQSVFSAAPADLLPVLRAAGVTHVYIGPANKRWQILRASSAVVYDRGGATILRIR